MTEKPYLDGFGVDDVLILQRAPNDGWIVLAKKEDTLPKVLGAFGSASQLIEALAEALGTND